MLTSKITVQLPHGLHARNTVHLLEIASSFNSNITLKKDGVFCPIDKRNIENIMVIMDFDVKKEEEIYLLTDGIDEISAMDAITKFLLGN